MQEENGADTRQDTEWSVTEMLFFMAVQRAEEHAPEIAEQQKQRVRDESSLPHCLQTAATNTAMHYGIEDTHSFPGTSIWFPRPGAQATAEWSSELLV